MAASNSNLETNGTQKAQAMTFKFSPSTISRPQLLPPIVCSRRLYIQIAFILILLLIFFILRTLSNMRVVFVNFHMESDTDGELVILPENFAMSRGALCLDGTPPAFYFRHGAVGSVNSWMIHLQPGAWCTTLEECYSRSFTMLGSSLAAPTAASFEGILSNDETVNPDFYSWNMAQLLYCDGGSFVGNRSGFVEFKSRPLFMRGGLVFEALIEYLLKHTSLASADQVILSGTSSGGLAALIQADRLREKLPQSIKTLHVLIDGSLFLDQPDVSGHHIMADILRRTFQLHYMQESQSLRECTQHGVKDHQWRCLLPEVFHKHVFSPAFFFNSLYDTWYTVSALKTFCATQGKCSGTQLKTVNNMRDAVLKESADILESGKHGVFLTSCPSHSILMNSKFTSLRAKSLSPQQALALWIRHQKTGYNTTDIVSLQDSLKKCQTSYTRS